MEALQNTPNAESLEQLETISKFRLQLLLAQVKSDMTEGLPKANGTRKAPSVRSNNRILFSALSALSGGQVTSSKPVDELEQRAVFTMVECFNGIMLKLALDEAKKRKENENVGTEKQTGE